MNTTSSPEPIEQKSQALLVATHLAPSVMPLYRLIAERIGERLERPALLVVADSYERCAQDLDHVCFVCSIPYLLLARSRRIRMRVLAAPVLTGARHENRPIYFSDVIVPASSDLRIFRDLAGRRFAYNEPYSHSGYLVVLHALAVRGLSAQFFGEMVEVGFHQTAIQMVADGSVDGAAIDSQVLSLALREDPSLADRIRIVDVLGPSTIQPVVASIARLTRRDRASVRDVLVSLADGPDAVAALDAAGVAGFVAVGARDYADIGRMFDRVVRAGLLPSWWWPRWHAMVGDSATGPQLKPLTPAPVPGAILATSLVSNFASFTFGEQAIGRGDADGAARQLHPSEPTQGHRRGNRHDGSHSHHRPHHLEPPGRLMEPDRPDRFRRRSRRRRHRQGARGHQRGLGKLHRGGHRTVDLWQEGASAGGRHRARGR